MAFHTPLTTLLAIFLALGACAPRELPGDFPKSSAASPSADEVAPRAVDKALIEEPPLPGEDTSRWPGLAPAAAPEHDHGAAPSGVVYTCPMHPEIVRNAPGDCPICGMTLVVRKP